MFRGHGDPAILHELAGMRRSGRFDEAQAALERLRNEWAGRDAERLARLEREAGELTAVRAAYETLRAELLQHAPEKTYAAQMDRLRAIESGTDSAAAVAAHLLRAELRALREGIAAPASPPQEPGTVAPPVAVAPTEPAPPPDAAPAVPVAPESHWTRVAEDAERLAAEGHHAQALETLRVALADAPSDLGQPLRDRLGRLRTTARVAMERLLAQAARMEESGRTDEAIGFLRGHAARFPKTGDLASLANALARLEERVRAAAAEDGDPTAALRRARRRETLTVLAGTLEKVQRAELDGDLDAARAGLREGAARVRDRDPLYARELEGRAADFAHMQALGAALGGREPRWRERPPAELVALVETAASPAPAWVGLAVRAFRAGEGALAEDCLVRALRAQPSLAAAIDGVLRRGRGEPGESGYALVEGRFEPARFVAARAQAATLVRGLAQALRGDEHRLELFLEEALSPGPDAIDALVLALRRQHETLVAQLGDHALRRGPWAALAAQREQLDAARREALELIFDEERYFYPYRPPAVAEEKAVTYGAVQAEVERRVARLRILWQDTSRSARIPSDLRALRTQIARVAQLLGRLGETPRDAAAQTEWIDGLPDGVELTLQAFCRSRAERDERSHAENIGAFNEIACGPWSVPEREILKLTNAYRRMFGLLPFAANDRLHAAARAHAIEMHDLGYLGHFSQKPGRGTPFDRMRAEGYEAGSGENVGNAVSVGVMFVEWCGSSAHHRNLLERTATETGVGHHGQSWVQTFGRDEEYRAHPAFGKPR